MLEIITNGVKLDLSSDTAITIQYDNPIFESNGIPTPFSFTYTLPLTTRNLTLLLNPDRVPSNVNYSKRLATTIRFAGMDITSGYQTIEITSDDGIEVSFNSIIFPDISKLPLYKLPFEKLFLGYAEKVDWLFGYKWDTSLAAEEYVRVLTTEINNSLPNFIPATMIVKGRDLVPNIEYSELTNQRSMRINPYVNILKPRKKHIPAFSVGYIIKNILPDAFGIFDRGDFAKLMLVCSYHPAYQTKDDANVWNFDKDTGMVTLNIADFMPDVSFEDFLCEMLKLACASMYISNGKPVFEYNSTIVGAKSSSDWSDKIIGNPVIGVALGSRYNVGYSDLATDNEHIPAERQLWVVPFISDMITMFTSHNSNPGEVEFVGSNVFIQSTRQTYQVEINEVLSKDYKYHFDFKLVADTDEKLDAADDDERGTFDMVVNAAPVRMVVGVDVKTDNLMVPSFDGTKTKHQYIYCPEVDMGSDDEKPTRPDKLTIGLYQGMTTSMQHSGIPFEYPAISRYNYNTRGVNHTATSLDWTGEFGLLNKYHKEYKAWIEKDKRTVKADVLLSSVDLRNLDLRKKCHINGRNFLIKSLSVTLTSTMIEPAEVEFWEV